MPARIIVVDLETTGKLNPATGRPDNSPSGPSVVELSAVACDEEWTPLSEFTQRVSPIWALTEQHRETLRTISKIDPDSLAAEPGPTRVAYLFLDWVREVFGIRYRASELMWADDSGHKTFVQLTSYGLAFEQGFLDSPWWGVTHLLTNAANCSVSWGPCLLLAASQALWKTGELEKTYSSGPRFGKPHFCSLKRACLRWNIPYHDDCAHNSLYDCHLALQLGKALGIEPLGIPDTGAIFKPDETPEEFRPEPEPVPEPVRSPPAEMGGAPSPPPPPPCSPKGDTPKTPDEIRERVKATLEEIAAAEGPLVKKARPPRAAKIGGLFGEETFEYEPEPPNIQGLARS